MINKYGIEIRDGIKQFSVVYPYWTDLTYSEDNSNFEWDNDLDEHRSFKNPWPETDLSMTIDDELGGFGVDINSLEELKELSNFFLSKGYNNQLIRVNQECSQKEKRIINCNDDFWSDQPQHSLLLYPINYKDYPKLRKDLLELYKIGYLVVYKNMKCY